MFGRFNSIIETMPYQTKLTNVDEISGSESDIEILMPIDQDEFDGGYTLR